MNLTIWIFSVPLNFHVCILSCRAFKYVLKKKMPSETNAMDNISKQEEDTEKSNEHSVTLMTLNSTSGQESSLSTKQINADVANVYNGKVSTSDHQIRIKILNSTGDEFSSTSSVTTNDLLENICLQDKITG